MKIPVQADLLPAFAKIVQDAEDQLTALCGYPVSIALNVHREELNETVLARLVCDEFGVKWKDVVDHSRMQHLVRARIAYAYLCRVWLKKSLMRTGALLGRDNTSIINYLDQVQNEKGPYMDGIRAAIQNIEKKLQNEKRI